jgi:succinyl-diaminopimelate desuccinylase
MKAFACAGCVLMALAAGRSYAVDDLARLEHLIAIPSVSSNIVEVNRAVDFLDGELGRDGLWRRIETMSDGRRVLFAANVETDQPDILLSAHIDVVPALLPEQYRARRENGRIYGRGASDCKEHVILCARLMRELKGRVSIGAIFGSDEEMGGASTAFMLDRGYGASKMVVVLDSEQFAITTRQKGLARYVIEAYAPAVHTGMVKGASPNAVRDLVRGFESAAAEIPDHEDGTWRDVLMMERVSGTRTQAEIEISVRCANPGGWGRIEDLLRGKFGRDLRCIRKGEPVMRDESQPYLVDFLARMRHRWPDRNVGFYHLNSSTDARHLQRLNLPMLILGVDARGAHSADEWVDVASLDEYSELLSCYLLDQN